MQSEILLLGKKIIVDASPVVLSYSPDENWREVWEDKGGHWTWEVRMTVGAINGHNFLIVDEVLIQELVDNMDPIVGGHVGFSPYSTKLKIKDIEVREIYWEKREQSYLPEF